MKKKHIAVFIIIILVFLIPVCGYRYYKINKDVSKEYLIDKYSLEQNIILDDIEMKVISFKVEKRNIESDGDDNIGCTFELKVKNISKNTVNISPLVEESKLSSGVFYQDYANVTGELKKIKSLSPGDEANLTFTYFLFKEAVKYSTDENEFKFFIAKSLYKNEILEKMNDLRLYSKCVELKGE
jgi:hypothetical protein